MLWIWVALGIIVLLLVFKKREGFEAKDQPTGIRYIAIGSPGYLQISQLQVMSGGINVAAGKRAMATSEIAPEMPKLAVDGVSAPRPFPSIYASGNEHAAWAVDLGQEYTIDEIVFYNRSDGCGDRAAVMKMVLFDGTQNPVGDAYPFTSEQVQHFTFSSSSTPTNGMPANGMPPVSDASPGADVSADGSNGTLPAPGRCNFSSCAACTTHLDSSGVCYWNAAESKCGTEQIAGYSRNCSGTGPDTCTTNTTCDTCKGKKGPTGSCAWCGTSCMDPGNAGYNASCSTSSCDRTPVQSTSDMCSTKLDKTSCTQTLASSDEGTFCNWSDTTNKCTAIAAGSSDCMSLLDKASCLSSTDKQYCAWSDEQGKCGPLTYNPSV